MTLQLDRSIYTIPSSIHFLIRFNWISVSFSPDRRVRHSPLTSSGRLLVLPAKTSTHHQHHRHNIILVQRYKDIQRFYRQCADSLPFPKWDASIFY